MIGIPGTDGRKGYLDAAPYDVIYISAAVRDIPWNVREFQLLLNNGFTNPFKTPLFGLKLNFKHLLPTKKTCGCKLGLFFFASISIFSFS